MTLPWRLPHFCEWLGIAAGCAGIAVLLGPGAGWLALGLLAVVASRRFWQELFGPVLRWELVRQARRGRFFVLRIVYLAVLLAALAVQYVRWFGARETLWGLVTVGARIEPEDCSDFAQSVFRAILVVQLGAVLILTPGFTAGAIAEERERRTLDNLLITHLSDGAVVVGKLMARLGGLSLLLLSSLPVLAGLQLLGGIDPHLLLGGYVVTFLTMLGLGSVAILLSSDARERRLPIFLTYALAVGYLATTWLIYVSILQERGWWGRRLTSFTLSASERVWFFLGAGNPAVAWGRIEGGLAKGLKPEEALPPVLLDFALFHGLLAIVCLYGAARALRRGETPTRKQPDLNSPLLTGTVLPPVWEERPLLWKERYAERGWSIDARLGDVLLPVGALMLLAGTLSSCLLMSLRHVGQLREEINLWLSCTVIPVALVAWLAVAARAAVAFSSERARGTLDSLLTTDLTNFEIVDAKWRGSLLAAVNTWYGLTACVLLGGVWGLGLFGMVLVPAVIAIQAGLAVSVGLACSLTASSTWHATARTLVWLTLLTVGHWALFGLASVFLDLSPHTERELARFHAVALTPPITLLHAIRSQDPELVLASVLVHGMLAALLLRYVHRRFARATGRMPVMNPRGDTV
jgi:ABC-type transport system involved in multi-copper enzyme maturation permease subunit